MKADRVILFDPLRASISDISDRMSSVLIGYLLGTVALAIQEILCSLSDHEFVFHLVQQQ